MLRQSLLTLLLLFACSQEPAHQINDKDIFFNNTIVDGILDVEEAQRDEFLQQYVGKQIVVRAKINSIHETLATEETASYGKIEVLALSADVVRDVDVEYRIYITEAESQLLTHKLIDIAFTGTIKRIQWLVGNDRVLRVYLIANQIEARSQ